MDNSSRAPAEDIAARITALEETVSFQQRLIEQLHEALVALRGDLATAERQAAHAATAVDRLSAALEDDLPHEKPPHY